MLVYVVVCWCLMKNVDVYLVACWYLVKNIDVFGGVVVFNEECWYVWWLCIVI